MGSKSSKRSDNGQQVCEKKSAIVNLTIENLSGSKIIVFDAEAEVEVKASDVNDPVDDALRRKEVEACRQPHEIFAHSTITLQREVGASFRFWTEKGMMAFAIFADDLEETQEPPIPPLRILRKSVVSSQTPVNEEPFHAPISSAFTILFGYFIWISISRYST